MNCTRSKDAECRKCGKIGHFQKMCHTKMVADTKGKSSDQTPKVGRVSNVEHIESSSEDDSEDEEVYVFRVSTPQFANDLYPVELGNQNVNLLIDSGCNLNILDEKVFHTLKPQPALTPSHTRIYPYQADKQLEVLGMFKTMLTVSDKSTHVKFYVVKGKGALLGRPAAEKLGVLRVGPPVNEHATVASVSDKTSRTSLLNVGKSWTKTGRKLKFMSGDQVCISKSHCTFKKGYLPLWSQEIFIVTKIIPRVPPVYRL